MVWGGGALNPQSCSLSEKSQAKRKDDVHNFAAQHMEQQHLYSQELGGNAL